MPEHGTPLSAPVFDWGGARKAMDNVVRPDGSVNWRAAFGADPGVVKCEACGRHLWDEAAVIRCPCGATVGEGREEMSGDWQREIDNWLRENQRWLTTSGPTFGDVVAKVMRWGVSLGLERAACLCDDAIDAVSDAMAKRLREEKPYAEAR